MFWDFFIFQSFVRDIRVDLISTSDIKKFVKIKNIYLYKKEYTLCIQYKFLMSYFFKIFDLLNSKKST